jgi:sulfate-transporting ATPase
VGNGRIRPVPILIGVGLVAILLQTLTPVWQVSIATSFAVSLILLSVVILTGYTGQISLAQFAIAGLGAFAAGRLAASAHVPFTLAFVVGVVVMFPVGMILALPAVRTRGINLAIVTLGLGSAIELIVFNSPSLSGGANGIVVPSPTLFGWSLDSVTHPGRYAYFALAMFILFAVFVANVRRGRSGRRMLAIRTNERSAAALGISVRSVKLYAFGLSSSVAAAGGIIFAFENTNIVFSNFTSFTSVSDMAWSVLGGIGYILGPFIGAEFSTGSLGDQWFHFLAGGLGEYLQVLGGLLLMFMVVQNQNGMVREHIRQYDWLHRMARRVLKRPPSTVVSEALPDHVPQQIARRDHVLEVSEMGVRFGGVVAVDGVSLTVRSGQIVGLIGPNGAGKTTTIDGITGFNRPSSGSITFDGQDIAKLSVAKRSRLGLSRSFQSLELFDDMTVIDNIRTACDPRDTWSYVRDLVHPVNPPLPSEVVLAIREFHLVDVLDSLVEDLPYGRRRLVAIVRALATRPKVLLLDEPAAGLGSAEAANLARLVRRLPEEWGIGVLLVEHNMDFVMDVCDHIVVLDFGRTIATGDPKAVRGDAAVIAAYLGVETEIVA